MRDMHQRIADLQMLGVPSMILDQPMGVYVDEMDVVHTSSVCRKFQDQPGTLRSLNVLPFTGVDPGRFCSCVQESIVNGTIPDWQAMECLLRIWDLAQWVQEVESPEDAFPKLNELVRRFRDRETPLLHLYLTSPEINQVEDKLLVEAQRALETFQQRQYDNRLALLRAEFPSEPDPENRWHYLVLRGVRLWEHLQRNLHLLLPAYTSPEVYLRALEGREVDLVVVVPTVFAQKVASSPSEFPIDSYGLVLPGDSPATWETARVLWDPSNRNSAFQLFPNALEAARAL